MQRDLLTFALVKLLAFAPLFNAPKKHVLNCFVLEMEAICCQEMHRREQKACGRRERIFLNARRTHYLQIIQINYLSNYFNLLQEIKDGLEPSTRSHTIPALSKLL